MTNEERRRLLKIKRRRNHLRNRFSQMTSGWDYICKHLELPDEKALPMWMLDREAMRVYRGVVELQNMLNDDDPPMWHSQVRKVKASLEELGYPLTDEELAEFKEMQG